MRSPTVLSVARVVVAAAFGGAAACGSTLPVTPTAAFGEGVTLYPDSLFRGERVTLGGDVADLSKVRGPCGDDSEGSFTNYDNCVSSLRIPAGLTAIVYRDRNFSGASATYVTDVADLDVVTGPCKPGFNDCISSIRISRP
jgi:hypothetical protein